jgi:putative DNA primase/helicase
MPRNYGDRSEGFYRRLVIIPFTKAIPENKRDPDIRSKLAKERDGILMWALEGLRRLIRNEYRFSETETTKAEIERYRVESNSALQFFQECCKLDGNNWKARTDVFDAYKRFCQDNCLRPMSQTSFNKDIERTYPQITRGLDPLSKRRIWKGITFQPGVEF